MNAYFTDFYTILIVTCRGGRKIVAGTGTKALGSKIGPAGFESGQTAVKG